MLDCDENSTEELIKNLSKYKLRSDVKIEDFSSEFVIGVINYEKFVDLKKEVKSDLNTIYYRDTPIFSDPRNKKKIYIPSKWKVIFKVSENINKKLNEKI